MSSEAALDFQATWWKRKLTVWWGTSNNHWHVLWQPGKLAPFFFWKHSEASSTYSRILTVFWSICWHRSAIQFASTVHLIKWPISVCIYEYTHCFKGSETLFCRPWYQPLAIWVPVAFQWSPTINSPHSDQQQGLFLHATAVHWVHAHPSLWAFSGGRDVVKISVDKQQFVKHQQPHSPPLKSLRSSFFSVMMLNSIFNDSNSPHSLVYSCCQRICLLALCVNKQLSIVPNNMCISLMVIPLVF